jgi:type IV pilus assembly protein PilE
VNSPLQRHVTSTPGSRPDACPTAGFTLLDLVAALTIAGLLAAMAVPSYREQLRRAHRSEARAALLELATAEERFRLVCGRFASSLDPDQDTDCTTARLRFPAEVAGGTYALAVTSAGPGDWAATATAATGGSQADDRRCRVLGISGTGLRTALADDGTDSALECWSR